MFWDIFKPKTLVISAFANIRKDNFDVNLVVSEVRMEVFMASMILLEHYFKKWKKEFKEQGLYQQYLYMKKNLKIEEDDVNVVKR